jgi:hypothetical protein
MNERIRQLAEQAEEYAVRVATGDWEDGLAYQDLFNKKFAELIVRECAKVILETPVKYTEIDIMHIIRDNVKEHFGVEE